MKAKTKTKALLMSLCAVLLVAASVLGTMAYLTDSKDVKNTFTVGNVTIKLDEAKVDEKGNLVKNQDDTLADRVTRNEYKLLPGHTYVKDPTVTVLAPSVESYVRMKVTFNKASQIIAMCTDPEFAEDGPTGVENAYPLIRMVKFVEANAAKWDGIIPDNMVDTEEMLADAKYFAYDAEADTLTYYFYYTEPVAAIDADVKLATLFDSVKVPEWATGDQLKALQGFEINVVAEAIQADGFENVDAAWAAFAAQK
jgi:predicted ribosomally synthesized peptide with SipW-like signal peptide